MARVSGTVLPLLFFFSGAWVSESELTRQTLRHSPTSSSIQDVNLVNGSQRKIALPCPWSCQWPPHVEYKNDFRRCRSPLLPFMGLPANLLLWASLYFTLITTALYPTTWSFLRSSYLNGCNRKWQIRLHLWEWWKRVHWAPDQPSGYVGMLFSRKTLSHREQHKGLILLL